MKNMETKIETYINTTIRPYTRVDGGDIIFETYRDNILHVGAYADCAVCKCCDDYMADWIKKKLRQDLDVSCEVVINKHVPYYYE